MKILDTRSIERARIAVKFCKKNNMKLVKCNHHTFIYADRNGNWWQMRYDEI